MKKAVLIIIAVFVLGMLYPVAMIAVRLTTNGWAKEKLLKALREEYPALRFDATVSYESPRVYLRVHLGVAPPSQKEEVVEKLSALRVSQGIREQVWLWFCNDDCNDVPDLVLQDE